MSVTAVQASGVSQPAAAPEKAAASHGFSFHALLSALNPLQYLPVVGTIYRAATGDVIPDAVRYAGSMLASGLLGGPIGLLSNVALIIGEKVTGIDPEKIIADQFHKAPPAVATVTSPIATPAPPPVASASGATQLALSPQQLAAYGVHVNRSGTLQMGDIQGADVLNTIELARLDKAASAYAANQPTPAAPATRGL
ncbi:MAG TPA: hypothetical protein VHX39_32430 [Acetobacteraceae bacterium]|nr:hypothetical protein [Acetobacteraceae bacterium]